MKNNRYNICLGWRRSGTSMLMLALKEAGVPIVGFKYPSLTKYQNEETRKTIAVDGGMMVTSEKIYDSNPNGYWELASIVKNGLQKKHENIGRDGNLVKVMMDCFAISDFSLIDKVVIILRNPKKVIASYLKSKDLEQTEENIKSVSLAMLYTASSAMKKIEENKKETIIVYYEQLLKDPKTNLLAVCRFLDRKYHKSGEDVIEGRLDRITPISSKGKELKELMSFYGNPFQEIDIQELYLRIGETDKTIIKNK